jgi:hypothetical protein
MRWKHIKERGAGTRMDRLSCKMLRAERPIVDNLGSVLLIVSVGLTFIVGGEQFDESLNYHS